MAKYTTVKVSSIITRISQKTDVGNYTVGVIEAFLPTEEDMKGWGRVRISKWIRKNNNRMMAICDFLNQNDL